MKAFVFPGQASQFEGMGKDMYESSDIAKEMFDRANQVLGFDITKVMFEGTAEELKETKITHLTQLEGWGWHQWRKERRQRPPVQQSARQYLRRSTSGQEQSNNDPKHLHLQDGA